MMLLAMGQEWCDNQTPSPQQQQQQSLTEIKPLETNHKIRGVGNRTFDLHHHRKPKVEQHS
ncbi:hypothetical protein BLOT_002214 [Blomia tropicalis]|nr:hypothetical protein BLOT_002214 [Blomia tropicalis]